MKSRRGVTMLEMMFVMSACTALLTLTTLLLSRVMRGESRSRAQVGAERTTMRLSEQFRRDCHEARSVVVARSPQEGAALLNIELADGRVVEYQQSGGTLLRVETGGSRPQWREEYVFPDSVVLSVRELASPRRIEFALQNKQDDPSVVEGRQVSNALKPRVSLHAVAVVGRDLRFDTPHAGKGKSE